jgi:primosomal protein N'
MGRFSKEKAKKGTLKKLQEKNKDNNSFILKKEKKLKRTYYLTPEVIEFVEKTAKETGKKKSDVVNLALEFFKENLKIEE